MMNRVCDAMPSGSRLVSMTAAFILLTMTASEGSSTPAAETVPGLQSNQTNRPVVKVVEGGESKVQPEGCLGTIVGPGFNQPDRFPGYEGFVGWVSPVRLKNGGWLLGFSAG